MGFPVAFAGSLVSKKRFKTPSQKRAAKVLPSVVESAIGGNLTAVKLLDERRNIGIAKERAVWASGYNQVAARAPDVIAKYQAAKSTLPALDHSTPESAAASALGSPSAGKTTSAFDTVLDPIRKGVAESIQLAAAGAGTLGARAVAPAEDRGALNIPTDVKTLRNIALAAAGVVILVVVIVSLRR